MAKELYFQFIHPREICRVSGVPDHKLKEWIWKQEWKLERDAVIDSDLNKVKRSLAKYADDLQDICRDSLDIIRDSVRFLKREDEPLGLSEMKVLSEILGNIDKLARLETGKPTSILMTSYNQDDVLNLIREIQEVDEFCDYIDATEQTTQISEGDSKQPNLLAGIPDQVKSIELSLEAPRDAEESAESSIQRGEKEGIH
jgi:hypothetical protein